MLIFHHITATSAKKSTHISSERKIGEKNLLRPIYSEFYFMKIGRSRILIKYRKNKINSNEMLPILNLWILVPDTVSYDIIVLISFILCSLLYNIV